MAPPEPFARSTPDFYDWFRTRRKASVDAYAISRVADYGFRRACAQRLFSWRASGGGGEVPAGQPLHGRDFCLFGSRPHMNRPYDVRDEMLPARQYRRGKTANPH